MSAQRTTKSWTISRLFDSVLIAIALVLGVLGTSAVLSGSYQIRPILSGSMEPGLPTGGVVITERVPVAAIQVRDVIVIHRPDYPEELVVHRITTLALSDAGPVIETQGDANSTADSWKVSLRGDTAYRAVFALPLIGYAAVWAHGTDGRLVLMLGGLLLIAVAGIGAAVLSKSRKNAKPDDVRASAEQISSAIVEAQPSRAETPSPDSPPVPTHCGRVQWFLTEPPQHGVQVFPPGA